MNTHIKENIRFYNNNAKLYDKMFYRLNRNHLKKIKKITSFLDPKENETVLEIGVGSGIHGQWLLKNKKINFIGLDISEGMIKESKKRLAGCGNAQLIVGNGEQIPFKENSIDNIFCSTSLHHFPEPENGISAMVNVLKPKGKIVIMEPNKYFIKNYLQGKFIKIEKNQLLMTKKNLKRWTLNKQLKIIEISNFIYTPPFPKSFSKIYDLIDRILLKIPFLKEFSIMIYIAAEKN